MQTIPNHFTIRKNSVPIKRRSGIAFIYVALGMTVFLGVAAIVVDLGYAYTRRGEAQKAADSAAMAGASELAFGKGKADDAAKKYAEFYGYKNGVKGAFVETSLPTATVLLQLIPLRVCWNSKITATSIQFLRHLKAWGPTAGVRNHHRLG